MKLSRAARWKENSDGEKQRGRGARGREGVRGRGVGGWRTLLTRRVAGIKCARALIRAGGFSQIAVRCPRYFYTRTITDCGRSVTRGPCNADDKLFVF